MTTKFLEFKQNFCGDSLVLKAGSVAYSLPLIVCGGLIKGYQWPGNQQLFFCKIELFLLVLIEKYCYAMYSFNKLFNWSPFSAIVAP